MNITDEQSLLEVKTKVVNVSVVAICVAGTLAHGIAFIQALHTGFLPAFYFHSLLWVILITFTVFRKKFSNTIKAYFISFIVIATVAAGMQAYGILASSTVFIIGLPVFLIFILSLRESIIILFILIGIYLFTGYLFSIGVLNYDVILAKFHANNHIWLIGRGFDIIITSSALLFVGYYYTKVLNSNFKQIKYHKEILIQQQELLEEVVSQRTAELKKTNDDLTFANIELMKKTILINDKNKELQSTIQHLKDTQTQLVQSEKLASLGLLTAGIAHEIKNPLNFIQSGATGIKQELNDAPNFKNENTDIYTSTIDIGIQRVIELVKGLNQFSRENTSFEEECKIHEIINNCLVMLKSKYKTKAEIIKHFPDHELAVKGNNGKLHQVFLNLISNAIQAISSYGKITISTGVKNSMVVIQITDTGMGIKESDLQKITDPFFTTKAPGEGTGLGLSITYKIIMEHEGDLKFESEVGKGTTAKVSLPI